MTTDLLPMAPTNGTAKNEHCECAGDGPPYPTRYCQRYRREMAGRLVEICRGENVDPGEAAKYRALWANETPGQKAAANGHAPVDCPHRTPEALKQDGETKLRECPSCGGSVKLKVFGCDHPALAPHETTIQDCNVCAYRPKPTTGVRALILKNHLCPGDVLVMSAAIYSLHQANPGKFLTAVDTTAMQLWENNPDVVPAEKLSGMSPTTLEVHYPAVNQSCQRGITFMSAYCEYLADALNVKVPLATNRPMLYLSKAEQSWISQVQEITQRPTKFWLINAGHKNDYPTKAWGHSQFQKIVDILRGKVLFVQIGEAGHQHKPLKGVIDLLGKTDTRQVVRLAWNSSGVLTGVSFPMHLAAALERPCVAVMGGREPVIWNSYPRQTLMHTIGAMDCCRSGGCWKSRVVKLGDGDAKDDSLCEQPLPGPEPTGRCMSLISPEQVSEAILRYGT